MSHRVWSNYAAGRWLPSSQVLRNPKTQEQSLLTRILFIQELKDGEHVQGFVCSMWRASSTTASTSSCLISASPRSKRRPSVPVWACCSSFAGGVEEPASELSQPDSCLCLKRSAANMPVQDLALAYSCSVVLPKVCVCVSMCVLGRVLGLFPTGNGFI